MQLPEGATPPPSRRLVRKYAVVIASLVSGVLLISGLLELVFSYQENNTALSRIQREKATTAATRIGQFILETEDQISWTIRPSGSTPEQRQDDYLRLLRLSPAVTDLRYVDGAGLERLRISRVSLNAVDTLTDASTTPSYLAARHGDTYFSPIYYRDESEPYMTIAVSESPPSGGVTIAEVNLKFIWDVVSQIRVGTQGYAYVVDGSGQLIAHRDISRVLRRSDYSNLPQVRQARADQPSTNPLPDSTGESAIVARNPEGQEVLTAYEQIAPPGWWVFVEQPLEEAQAPLYASIVRTVLLLLVGLLLSAGASVFLARRMARPVQALQAGAASIGAGRLDQRIVVATGDELESLAQAFNSMAAQLSASYTDLELRVAERTQELVGALHDLQIASQHKSDFLASMSHELRTPLNAVIGFSEMLLHQMVGPINDKQADYLDDVLTSGQHLLSLINDMLDLSKIEAGKMSLDVTRFALPDLLEQTVGLLRQSAAQRGLGLFLHTDADLGEVFADERKIRQVLLNLLSNAVKFTPEGGRVDVIARVADGEVVVAVRDTGVGLSLADQARVFEAFLQAAHPANPRLTRSEGTGLGLTLAQRFVELHGGRLWVESAPGAGSTFTFTLPVTAPVPEAVVERSNVYA